MRRNNCNLDLRLLPPVDPSYRHSLMEESSESPQNEPQKLTIFYNGRVCVCDVTELQARSILWLASREMEEKSRTPTGLEPASPTIHSYQMQSPTGLSMKRSLQRFLQKRKNRIQATSPY